jgi:hypothetical protein
MTKFVAAVTELQTRIDPVTGTKVAAEVSIVVIGFPAPEKNTVDGTYKFRVTVAFVPSDASVTVGDDHKRLFCEPLKVLIKDLTRVELTSACTYTPKTTVKRSALQSSANTYDMSATAPGTSVDAIYGNSASAIALAFGAVLISIVALFM